jgi:integrase
VLAQLHADAALPETRQRDLLSAVRRMGELLDKPPAALPADLNALRPRINAVRPAAHGIGTKTWANLKAAFRVAVLTAGGRASSRVARSPAWQALHRRLPDKRIANGLSRFIGWCSREGIAPEQVDDAVMIRFRAAIGADTLVPDPNDCHRRSARLWNEAVERIPGWPRQRVAVPKFKRRSSLRLNDLPTGFGEDLQCHLDWAAGTDPLAEPAPPKPLAARTLQLQRTQLLLAASRLVASGHDPATITSLAALVTPQAVKTVLRSYIAAAADKRPTAFVRGLAITLVHVATHWVRVDASQLDALVAVKRRLGPTKLSLTEKNRSTLRRLEDRLALRRLLDLPAQLASEARRIDNLRRAAVTMQMAVAVTLLLHAPLRMANLHSLRLDRHLSRPGGPRQPWLISIPAAEAKNGEPLDYEIAGEAAALIDQYVRRYRAALVTGDCPFLFPGADGLGCKFQGTLAQQVKELVADRVGVEVTPHQFRHLAAQLLLRAAPGAYGAAQHLLGHRNPKTTTAFYAGIDTLAAGQHYDRILQETHARLPRPAPRKRRP